MSRNSQQERPRIDIDFGPHLKAARTRLGLSLRALAGDVGVSAALISQIELGRTQPSVSTLYALVQRLGMSLDGLIGTDVGAISERADRPLVVRAHEHPVLEIGNGVTWPLVAAGIGDALEAVVVTYAPGASSSIDGALTTHEGHEDAFVISGGLRLQLEQQVIDLGAGDSLSFASTRPHRLENPGDVPAVAMWLSTGESRFHVDPAWLTGHHGDPSQ